MEPNRRLLLKLLNVNGLASFSLPTAEFPFESSRQGPQEDSTGSPVATGISGFVHEGSKMLAG